LRESRRLPWKREKNRDSEKQPVIILEKAMEFMLLKKLCQYKYSKYIFHGAKTIESEEDIEEAS